MITEYKDIITDNPIREVWKNLRIFLDESFVIDNICKFHSIHKGKHKNNIKKQAKQINYCIRQAEEYFSASSRVSLVTRPLLLYYGTVSLTKALTLIRLKGEYSFDKLRATGKHKHHGLVLLDSINDTKPTVDIETFFSSLQCNIFRNKDLQNRPWGHFSLFYQSLVPCAYLIKEEIQQIGKMFAIKKDKVQSCSNLLDINSISTPFVCLTLIKILPDLCSDLIGLGINPGLFDGEVELMTTQHNGYHKKDYNFFIYDIQKEEGELLIKYYKELNPLLSFDMNFYNNIHFKITNDNQQLNFPEIIDDINNKKYFILKPSSYITEPVPYFIILFCLGMLCRYHPDIWVSIIDKNIRIAELTNTFLNLAYRKFPNLILDQMTLTKHYIHI